MALECEVDTQGGLSGGRGGSIHFLKLNYCLLYIALISIIAVIRLQKCLVTLHICAKGKMIDHMFVCRHCPSVCLSVCLSAQKKTSVLQIQVVLLVLNIFQTVQNVENCLVCASFLLDITLRTLKILRFKLASWACLSTTPKYLATT